MGEKINLQPGTPGQLARKNLTVGDVLLDWTQKNLFGKKKGWRIKDQDECSLHTVDPPGGTSSRTYSTPRVTTKQLFQAKDRKTIDV